jgi:hypothetical protein
MQKDDLLKKRDKKLNFTGNLLIDQNRFDIWHLDAGTWHYLPITQRERDANPNI